VGEAHGVEVAVADKTTWDEAMSSFKQARGSSAPKRPNPFAGLSLHAVRLMPSDDKSLDSLD